MKGNVVLMLTTLLTCLFPAYSQGFWLDTHQIITNKAIEAANLNSAIDAQTGLTNTLGIPVTVAPLTKPLKEWIWFGSRQEDEPLTSGRYRAHFYNPLNGSGLNDTFSGMSSYEWASTNDWSWKVAREDTI